jgi:hypothetical protein
MADRPTSAAPARRQVTRVPRITVRTRWDETERVYRVCVEVAADNVRVMLTHRQAWNHSQAVITAAHRAQFDAVMLGHFAGKLNVPMASVSNMIREVRKHRQPLTELHTDPLRFDAGVDAKTGRGFVAVAVGVERITRWSVTEADAYARTVIGMTERADLETGMFQTLTTWGAEEQRVRNALNDLHAPRDF